MPACANSSSVTSRVRSSPLLSSATRSSIDVEADYGKMPREIDGERQADITKPDNADPHEGEGRQARRSFPFCATMSAACFCKGRPRVRGLRGAPALLALGNREVQAPGRRPRLPIFDTIGCQGKRHSAFSMAR